MDTELACPVCGGPVWVNRYEDPDDGPPCWMISADCLCDLDPHFHELEAAYDAAMAQLVAARGD